MLLEELIKPNELDRKSKEMTYPNQYKVKDIGKKKSVSSQKVVVRDSKTGKVYGRRSITQK